MEIRDIQIENIEDGAYTGGFDAKLVSAKVRVTVENGQVTDIQLLEHENGQGAAAEVIVETVIQEQSLMVDAVSGATSSSHVILKAIENALNNPI